MDNSLSDVEFDGDNNAVGALIVGGVAIVCGIIGYAVKSLFSNKDAANALKRNAETEAKLNAFLRGEIKVAAAAAPAPVAAPAAA